MQGSVNKVFSEKHEVHVSIARNEKSRLVGHTNNEMTTTEPTYKKKFGAWGESFLDEWMQSQGWNVYRKNLKLRHGEIDRVYKKTLQIQKITQFCITEIKTIYCDNPKRFFSFFTEVGLSSLIKHNQIVNLYKYAENLQSRSLHLKNLRSKQIKNIHIRFFIVLKMYNGFEKESFFNLQKNYKVCLQTKDNLILAFTPEFR